MSEAKIERLSRELHAVYQEEARRQAGAGEDEVRHPDDYDALPEHTKNYDRVLARFIIEREEGLRQELASLRNAAREFLDSSEAAAKPMHSSKIATAAVRWQRAGYKLRALVKTITLVQQ